MKIGVPKEIKSHEYRVALTPSGVRELVANGHQISVESTAGVGAGFSDKQYIDAGAIVVSTAAQVFIDSELIVKVKEPQPHEVDMMGCGQMLFTYLHLAANKLLTDQLLISNITAIAYETIKDGNQLPLLAPMSEVAGRLSVQAGAYHLQKTNGGNGVLIGGIPGVPPANITVLGGGIVGTNAIKMAIGLGGNVTVIDKSIPTLRRLDDQFGSRITTVYSTTDAIKKAVANSDLVIGAVLIPGAGAPKLVTADMIKTMKPGSVVVDVAIDQGGCFETSKPTSHDNPTYVVDDVIHYCVANMPGAVPRTSTLGLTNATLPYVIKLAGKGFQALKDDRGFYEGLNTHKGHIANLAVGQHFNYIVVDFFS